MMPLRKKIAIEIEEDVHLEMKKIALENKMYVYDLYEGIAREFIKSDNKEKTLNEIRKED